MNTEIALTRARIAETGALLFERHLLDMAGGNISARVGDLLCITPRYSGLRKRWNLHPEDVMVVSLEGRIVEGSGELSRESKVHLTLHREFGDVGAAVVHAHSRHALVFAALARPIPPVLEATRKFGEVPVIPFAPAHSIELAEHVAAGIRGQKARITKQAAAVLAPYHGLFVMGKDLHAAADAVERIDTNAYLIIMGRLLGGSEMLAHEREVMESAMADFERNAAR